MESEHRFKPIEYTCPICGERSTFGKHFCQAEKNAQEPKRLPASAQTIWLALIAILLAEALLWGMIGIYSLYFLAAAPLAVALYLAFQRSPLGRSSVEFRELRKLAGGDEKAVERLIALEKKKRPSDTRRELVREILRQWRRDLR